MKNIKTFLIVSFLIVLACTSLYSEELIKMVKIPNKNFMMSETEITQELYESVMIGYFNPSEFAGKENPVENVSWYDAVIFCNTLSVQAGLEPVYSINENTDIATWDYTKGDVIQNESANGYRLPTVDEWKFAAKGGEKYAYAGSKDVDKIAWFSKNCKKVKVEGRGERYKTNPVGQKMPNGYGLYDMSGNVYEWCWDHPPFNAKKRYICGGSSEVGAHFCKINTMNTCASTVKYTDVGFRVVRSIN